VQIDEDLLDKCRNNDRKAQYELYRQCYGILFSICTRYERNKDDAEALLNMGFLKIATKLDKYSSSIPFEAWIRRIMINTIIDEYRKNKKQNEMLDYTDFEDHHYNIGIDRNDADKMFDAEELQLMVDRLPNVTQKVFNLHVIDGFSHKEISDELGISTGTSKWHVNNARKLLKGMLAEKVEQEKRKDLSE
jgi:RNA polymerase sigma-70 factor (ECF subfamily)